MDGDERLVELRVPKGRGPVLAPRVSRRWIWGLMVLLAVLSSVAWSSSTGGSTLDSAPAKAREDSPPGPLGAFTGWGLAILGAVVVARTRGREERSTWRVVEYYFGSVALLFLVVGLVNLFVAVPPVGQGLWGLKIAHGEMGFWVILIHTWATAAASYCLLLRTEVVEFEDLD